MTTFATRLARTAFAFTSASTDYDVAIGRYQLLTQLSNNAKNEPLKKGAVTLSRGDLITFR